MLPLGLRSEAACAVMRTGREACSFTYYSEELLEAACETVAEAALQGRGSKAEGRLQRSSLKEPKREPQEKGTSSVC